MQIDRLRLLGFKSFVEPTELIVKDGLTGVVGPNGCGKSNLLEALRWVMGETSYKTMRASTMDDVIFSGTQNRPARNFSEVTIFIDNSSRKAPAAYNNEDVLEVTRRIDREAGSAYRINGRDVRARDVQLLFADASTGAHSPALVRQGQIGQIINSKPQARRLVLEEAAGITGLHGRRHEAELRLRAAENNLQRLMDIQAQIGAQLGSLQRQARQAIRYREISGKLREAEALQYHLKWLELGERVQAEEASVKDALLEIAQLTKTESEALRKQNNSSNAIPPLRRQEADKSAALHRLIVERENLEREEAQARIRAAELESQIAQHSNDIRREEELIVEANAVVEQLLSERSELLDASAGRERTEQAARRTLEEISSKLTENENLYSSKTGRVAELRAKRNQFSQIVVEQTGIIEELDRQKTEIATELQRLNQSDDIGEMIEKSLKDIEILTVALDKEKKCMEEAEFISRQARTDLRAKQDLVTIARQSASGLDIEIETLSGLLISETPGENRKIIDLLEVEEGYELALAAALGDDLEAQDARDAPVRWTLSPETDEIAGHPGSGHKKRLEPLPADAIPLANFVKGPSLLSDRLHSIGVVDETIGPNAQILLHAGQRLVSKSGDLWRWDGYAVSAGASTSAAKRLTEKARLKSLMIERDRARSNRAAAEAEYVNAEQKAQMADAREAQTRKNWMELQDRLSSIRENLSNLERQKQAGLHRLGALNESIQNLSSGLQEARSRIARAQTELEHLPQLKELEDELEQHAHQLKNYRNQFTEARATMAGLEQECRIRKDRIDSIETELTRWKNRFDDARVQIESLKTRKEQAESRLNELESLPADIGERRNKILTAISQAEQNRKQSADDLVKAESELKELTKALGEVQSILAEAREMRAASEARLENTRERRAELARQIRSELDCAPDDCLTMSGSMGASDLPDLTEVEATLVKLRANRDRLGSVNLRAEEEAAQLSDQYESMESECTDLNEAILHLKRGIEDLNRVGRKRLLSAFDEVNGHFQQLFKTLFGGGEAQLQLVESEDPLQAGLEILARPPGKKPQILTLLSGGEKALTALSLIFAVFLTNPSPICVLDEVDAPLDDTNVERFCQLMDEMTGKTDTRFLVITHHPTTMARMDRLFGVTMAEKGVSQLVSVDLATAESFRAAG